MTTGATSLFAHFLVLHHDLYDFVAEVYSHRILRLELSE
jgi:hypothetical protein